MSKINTQNVISKFVLTHGGRYDYKLVNYINARTKVKIICKTHGCFEQIPYKHIKGANCPKCEGYNKTNKDIVDLFSSVHGDKYDYSLVEYTVRENKVKIICNIHGVFEQQPSNHLLGKGCKKCYNDKLRDNPLAWNLNSWENASLKSKNFDSFKVYIIHCYNDKESFYKIGRTFCSVKYRFRTNLLMPYNYDILKEFIFNTSKEAFDYENKLKKMNKEFKYTPNISFGGSYECFTKIIT